MKKILFLIMLICISFSLFATQKTGRSDSTQQYMLIARYKEDMKMPDAEALKLNGKHWSEFMGKLGQTGKLISAYRLENGVFMRTGRSGVITETTHAFNNDIIGSVIIIKAANMQEARDIADKCPIFDFGGSMEIRPIVNTIQ